MSSIVEIYDLEKSEKVSWQISPRILTEIHNLERDEEILLAKAMIEEMKNPREIMDEIDKEFWDQWEDACVTRDNDV